MNVKLSVVIIALLGVIHTGKSLKCYECYGEPDEDCAKGGDKLTSVECGNDDAPPESYAKMFSLSKFGNKMTDVPQGAQHVCIEGTYKERPGVIRTCTVDWIEGPDRCKHLLETDYFSSCDTCTTDLCNKKPL